MKALLISTLCLLTFCVGVTALLFSWWQAGSIVSSQHFDAVSIEVRKIPVANTLLKSASGLSEYTYLITAKGTFFQTGYVVFQDSGNQFKTVKTEAIVRPNDERYITSFNNNLKVGLRMVGTKRAAEWFIKK